jgi:hypothetical protein
VPLKGTTYLNGRWIARITVNNTGRHLGVFSSEEEAHKAYLEARAKIPFKKPSPKQPTVTRKPKTPRGTKAIPLTKGYWAIVSIEDYAKVRSISWYASTAEGSVYVYGRLGGRAVLMHRFLTNAPEGSKVLHKDGNNLNNVRSNLLVTDTSGIQRHRKKNQNSPYKYKGVRFHKNKWYSHISYLGKKIHIGVFESELIAAKAYDKKALELFGSLAMLNNA